MAEVQRHEAYEKGVKDGRESALQDLERVARGEEPHILTLDEVKNTWDEDKINANWDRVKALMAGDDA
jgi:hypothetical protein